MHTNNTSFPRVAHAQTRKAAASARAHIGSKPLAPVLPHIFTRVIAALAADPAMELSTTERNHLAASACVSAVIYASPFILLALGLMAAGGGQ